MYFRECAGYFCSLVFVLGTFAPTCALAQSDKDVVKFVEIAATRPYEHKTAIKSQKRTPPRRAEAITQGKLLANPLWRSLAAAVDVYLESEKQLFTAFYELRDEERELEATKQLAVLATVGDWFLHAVFDETPDYSAMLKTAAEEGIDVAIAYREYLLAERDFLMARQEHLEKRNSAIKKIVEVRLSSKQKKAFLDFEQLFRKGTECKEDRGKREFFWRTSVSVKAREEREDGVQPVTRLSNAIVVVEVLCAAPYSFTDGELLRAAIRQNTKSIELDPEVVEEFLETAGLLSSRNKLNEKYVSTPKLFAFYIGNIDLETKQSFSFNVLPVAETVFCAQRFNMIVLSDEIACQGEWDVVENSRAFNSALYQYRYRDQIKNAEEREKARLRANVSAVVGRIRGKLNAKFRSSVSSARGTAGTLGRNVRDSFDFNTRR